MEEDCIGSQGPQRTVALEEEEKNLLNQTIQIPQKRTKLRTVAIVSV